MDQDGVYVPKIATLEGFAEAVEKNDGLAINSLPLGTVLLLETQHSHYRLTILNPNTREVIISSEDSKVIRDSVKGILNGSTFGGSMIRNGWINTGRRLEVRFSNGSFITTSLVKSISLISPVPQGNLPN